MTVPMLAAPVRLPPAVPPAPPPTLDPPAARAVGPPAAWEPCWRRARSVLDPAPRGRARVLTAGQAEPAGGTLPGS
jgi:hypothetical protein